MNTGSFVFCSSAIKFDNSVLALPNGTVFMVKTLAMVWVSQKADNQCLHDVKTVENLELSDRRNLDEQLLDAERTEVDFGGLTRWLSGHGDNLALAEVGVLD